MLRQEQGRTFNEQHHIASSTRKGNMEAQKNENRDQAKL